MEFFSHGKLLLTGEYTVLDGATALAVPTKFGQSLQVEPGDTREIQWKSLDEQDVSWFSGSFRIEEVLSQRDSGAKKSKGEEVRKMLFLTLRAAAKLNPKPLQKTGLRVTSKVDFPREWGLGTSSTLVNNVASWFEIDPFELLDQTFGGSGYDIAVAQHKKPITYELSNGKRKVLTSSFDPPFKNEIFFVHLNRKQNSRESIAHYRRQEKDKISEAVEKISGITHRVLNCENLQEFEMLLEIHETIISQVTGLPKVKNQLFPDYPGAVKSLGGWGGDFILATGGEAEKDYFRKKGFLTVIPFSEMLL